MKKLYALKDNLLKFTNGLTPLHHAIIYGNSSDNFVEIIRLGKSAGILREMLRQKLDEASLNKDDRLDIRFRVNSSAIDYLNVHNKKEYITELAEFDESLAKELLQGYVPHQIEPKPLNVANTFTYDFLILPYSKVLENSKKISPEKVKSLLLAENEFGQSVMHFLSKKEFVSDPVDVNLKHQFLFLQLGEKKYAEQLVKKDKYGSCPVIEMACSWDREMKVDAGQRDWLMDLLISFYPTCHQQWKVLEKVLSARDNFGFSFLSFCVDDSFEKTIHLLNKLPTESLQKILLQRNIMGGSLASDLAWVFLDMSVENRNKYLKQCVGLLSRIDYADGSGCFDNLTTNQVDEIFSFLPKAAPALFSNKYRSQFHGELTQYDNKESSSLIYVALNSSKSKECFRQMRMHLSQDELLRMVYFYILEELVFYFMYEQSDYFKVISLLDDRCLEKLFSALSYEDKVAFIDNSLDAVCYWSDFVEGRYYDTKEAKHCDTFFRLFGLAEDEIKEYFTDNKSDYYYRRFFVDDFFNPETTQVLIDYGFCVPAFVWVDAIVKGVHVSHRDLFLSIDKKVSASELIEDLEEPWSICELLDFDNELKEGGRLNDFPTELFFLAVAKVLKSPPVTDVSAEAFERQVLIHISQNHMRFRKYLIENYRVNPEVIALFKKTFDSAGVDWNGNDNLKLELYNSIMKLFHKDPSKKIKKTFTAAEDMFLKDYFCRIIISGLRQRKEICNGVFEALAAGSRRNMLLMYRANKKSSPTQPMLEKPSELDSRNIEQGTAKPNRNS